MFTLILLALLVWLVLAVEQHIAEIDPSTKRDYLQIPISIITHVSKYIRKK